LPGLAAELKERASQAGAGLAGVAPARPRPEASFLSQWLRAGRHASMGFMRRDASIRQDVRLWYPQARSVLVCGFGYDGHGAVGTFGQAGGGGRLARYAAREDYHLALKRRLESVLAWLRRRSPGADGRIFADTSPVLERLYGAAAGLGWIGRNCMLVSEAAGSFFLIAGLALNLELEADRPVADRCGSCRRCLDACPSGALARERVLDAGLCTAYLTCEHRGSIPEERRAGVGTWVAGCDLCQEACPWNAKARADGGLKAVVPRELPLETLALEDEAGFCERFGPTPLARLKPQGLRRNALLAMGNSGEARFRPILERFRADPDPVLREQAQWSLARLPS